MKLLAIETSCDETAAAVVEDGRMVLSNIIASQVQEHIIYGGVVPEIASRRHVEAICGVVDAALKDAGCTFRELDGIAVTYAPGLIGALLVDVLPEIFRSLQNYMQLIWGFAIIVLMIFMPSGLGGLYETIQSKLRRRKKLQARAEQEVEG